MISAPTRAGAGSEPPRAPRDGKKKDQNKSGQVHLHMKIYITETKNIQNLIDDWLVLIHEPFISSASASQTLAPRCQIAAPKHAQ